MTAPAGWAFDVGRPPGQASGGGYDPVAERAGATPLLGGMEGEQAKRRIIGATIVGA